MWISQRNLAFSAGAALLLLCAPALAFNVNKSIKVGDGSESGSHSTVNGSITVGSDARVDGSLETVNGTIRVGDRSVVGDLETVNGGIRVDPGVTARDISSVNGSIRLSENVTVNGSVSVVNGKIALDAGTRVENSVSNVNGEFSLRGAEIGQDLKTVNGDVTLSDMSIVHGDLVIQKSRGWNSSSNSREPKIVIGPGSQVMGAIVLEREVRLYISDTAIVGGVSGEMSLDDAIRFSGDRP